MKRPRRHFRFILCPSSLCIALLFASPVAADETDDARDAFRAEMWNTGYALSRFADREDAEIQFYLGHCLENGLGDAVRDIARARRWYERSAAQGNEMAKAALSRLDGKAREDDEQGRKRQEAERKRLKAEAERKRLEEAKRHVGLPARIPTEKELVDALQARIKAERQRIAAERKKAGQSGYRFDQVLGKAVRAPVESPDIDDDELFL